MTPETVSLFTIQTASAQTAPTSLEASKYTGLHLAAFQGDTSALEKLIDAKEDLEARDSAGRTPIIVAAFASHEDIVRLPMICQCSMLHWSWEQVPEMSPARTTEQR